MPTAQALQQQCGATPSQLRQWLTALYQDFLAAIETPTGLLHFSQAEHCFVVSGPRASPSFRCRVQVTPRIGENIDLGFVSGATRTSNFYVKGLASEYENGRITTYVYLTAEPPDRYFDHLMERATFEG